MAPMSLFVVILACVAASVAFPQNPEINQIPFDADQPQENIPLGPEPTQFDLAAPVAQPEVIEPQAPVATNGRAADDDDDDDDDKTPSFSPFGRKGVPSTNVFFPVSFGGSGLGRKGAPSSPHGATAIANSFSTGRRGVATSHAIVYGGRPTNGNDQPVKV